MSNDECSRACSSCDGAPDCACGCHPRNRKRTIPAPASDDEAVVQECDRIEALNAKDGFHYLAGSARMLRMGDCDRFFIDAVATTVAKVRREARCAGFEAGRAVVTGKAYLDGYAAGRITEQKACYRAVCTLLCLHGHDNDNEGSGCSCLARAEQTIAARAQARKDGT